MKAIGYYKSLPIDNEQALVDLEIPTPKATGHDILLKLRLLLLIL